MSKQEKVTDKMTITGAYGLRERDIKSISLVIDFYGGLGIVLNSDSDPAYLPVVKLWSLIDGLSDKNAAYIYDLLVERFKRKMIGG